MHYLGNLDLDAWPDPTVILKTDALRDQKLVSRRQGQWLHSILEEGRIGRLGEEGWPGFAPSADLYESYLDIAKNVGGSRSSGQSCPSGRSDSTQDL